MMTARLERDEGADMFKVAERLDARPQPEAHEHAQRERDLWWLRMRGYL